MPVTSHAADVRLAARCRAGDLAAFEEIYRVYSTRLYAVAYRMLGHAEDAEDMLQEIFLLAFRKMTSFKGDASLGTWLYRLGVNACLDRLRSKARRNDQQTEWLDDDVPPVRATTDAGGGVLHRFPVEAGVSPLFRVVDDAEAATIRSRARARAAERSLGLQWDWGSTSRCPLATRWRSAARVSSASIPPVIPTTTGKIMAI